jgi:hypothetical protein
MLQGMKALPALLTAVVGLTFLSLAPNASAQLFHIVSKDSSNPWGTTDSWNNTGVAVNAKFEFSVAASIGTLKLTLTNLAGTAKSIWGDGSGNYMSGILTQFGFDLPANLSLIAGSGQYAETLTPLPSTEPSGINFVLDVSQDIGSWNFDFGADATSGSDVSSDTKGLSGGYSAIFTFKFTGSSSALANFNSSNFFKKNGSGATDPDMGFRFDSVGPGCDDVYDKFAYWVNDNPPIPEPSTYGAVAAGLLFGVIGFRRFRTARKLS